MQFYGRERELEQLGSITAQAFASAARFTVMTGRRRVGKTELIRQHMKSLDDEAAIFWFVGRRHPAVLQEEFARVAADRFPDLAGARYERLSGLVRALFLRARQEPLLLVLDEFQNFMHVDPGMFSDLQALWDELNREARCHLLVAGSTYTLMKRIFEDAKEPLFGRATDRIALEPFGPSALQEILSENARAEDLLFYRSIFGGIPRYYELIDRHGLWKSPPVEMLVELVFDRSAVLYNEGRELLMEEFGRVYQVYFSVLSAIARGNTQVSRIADAAGVPISSVGKYLDQLQHRYELVERRAPVLEPKSKKGSYRLRDPFLAFWFRYVHRNASFLEVGAADRVAARVMDDLPNYLGPGLESLCRAVLRERSRRGEKPLGISLEFLGGWWDRGRHEIDVVAGGRKRVALVECKVAAARATVDALKKFLAGCEAFRTRHPHYEQARYAVSYDRPTRAQRKRWARAGVQLMSFGELLTR